MQDKHFSQTFENKANVYDAEHLCLQNGLVFKDAEGLTDPSEIGGVNGERDLPACMDGIAGSPFLPFRNCIVTARASLLRWGVSVAGNFCATSWEFHFQRRFFPLLSQCGGSEVQETEAVGVLQEDDSRDGVPAVLGAAAGVPGAEALVGCVHRLPLGGHADDRSVRLHPAGKTQAQRPGECSGGC